MPRSINFFGTNCLVTIFINVIGSTIIFNEFISNKSTRVFVIIVTVPVKVPFNLNAALIEVDLNAIDGLWSS